MTTLDPWQELIKGLQLAEELEKQRPVLKKEYRIYYNDDGSIIGLWESNHPEGNYIVVNDPDIFHRHNTNWLRVQNNELKIINPHLPNRVKLKKSDKGQRVVKGHSALVVQINEDYTEIEYYEQTNN